MPVQIKETTGEFTVVAEANEIRIDQHNNLLAVKSDGYGGEVLHAVRNWTTAKVFEETSST